MITAFGQNQVSIASTELSPHLKAQVQTNTHTDFCFSVGQSVNDIDTATRIKLEQELYLGQKLLEAKQKLVRRGEFSQFQKNLLINLADGRRVMRVFNRFEGWSIDKLLTISSAVNLYTLCQSKFDQVVQQLREAANLSKEFVKNLVKEVRDAATERRKKQQTEPGSGCWRRDLEGGGRHYQLPPMYNEEVAVKIETLSQERGVRPITIVEEAIVAYGETALKTGFPSQATANPKGDQPTINELKCQHQEEMQAAVTEMRDEHIRMQRRIIELEQLVQTPFSPDLVAHSFSTWVEFADTVKYDSTTLLNTVKPWSLQERQTLSTVLADYLSEDQSNLEQVAWVPDKLLHSALSKLSFTVSKINGPDNMIDEPEIEEINGCRFMSVQHLGTRRREQWTFEGYGGRMLTVGRDEFKIE